MPETRTSGSEGGEPKPIGLPYPYPNFNPTMGTRPVRTSGNPVPPEGIPQVSAGTVAPRAQPRPGAGLFSGRQAPNAGPETSEGDRSMEGNVDYRTLLSIYSSLLHSELISFLLSNRWVQSPRLQAKPLGSTVRK